MECLHSEEKTGILALLVYYTLICSTITKGQQSTYVIENSPGCVNNTVTSWNIPPDFSLTLVFNKLMSVCTLAGIPGGDPYIDINTNYRGRISCGVDVVQKYTFICFTTAVTVSDAGVYTARLGTDSSTAINNTLFVMRPPTKPVISLQGELINQRQHSLTCTAVSTSVPTTGLPLTYTWTVGGAAISDSRFTVTGSGNSVLMINPVQKQDSGKRIQCTAREEKGMSSAASGETILDVMYVPEISVGPSNRVAILGDNNVQFVCTVVDTNPVIQSFRWTKGGSQISTNPTYTIATVQKSDDGTYQCTASNSVGTSQPATVTFDVQYPPTTSPLTNRNIIEGSDLTITCSVTNGNPSQTTVYWIKSGDSGFRQNGVTLQITGINRSSSGTYTCTAENTYTVGGKGTGSQSVDVNVLYPPTVSPLTNRDIIEGSDLTITCSVTNGNPSQTTVYWTKSGDSGFRQNGATLQLAGINRSSSGTYTCTAENTYTVGGKGTGSQSVDVNVLYPPTVSPLTKKDIIEGSDLTITCSVTNGNPSQTIIYWTKSGDSGFRQNGATLQITKINRSSFGTYTCTAENTYTVGGKGTASQSVDVNVLYPPTVSPLTNRTITEGSDLTITCSVSNGNPSQTTVYWTKSGDSGFRQNGATLQIAKINRSSSGTYTCTAETTYTVGGKGTGSQSVDVNVLYPPVIQDGSTITVNESQRVTLTRTISSNPASNTSWYYGDVLLHTQISVKTAVLIIEYAQCTSTGNYTLIANNGITHHDSAQVELLVNCKPQTTANITLGMTCERGIEFSTTLIAYPQPRYTLYNENKTVNEKLTSRLSRNAVNNFTITYNKASVQQNDYGVYLLEITNSFGTSDIYINIIPQRKPNAPEVLGALCDVETAEVKWKSSFNGGATQKFTVITPITHQSVIHSGSVADKGVNEEHKAIVGGLRPFVTYVFNVSASNSHGETLSTNGVSCRTRGSPGTDSHQTAVDVGTVVGAIIGSVAFLLLTLLLVVILRRHYTCISKLEKKNTEQEMKPVDGFHLPISEQTVQLERGVYEELTGREDRTQYEDLSAKGKDESKTQTYESLQGSSSDNKYEELSNVTDHNKDQTCHNCKTSVSADVYVNTSFQDK